MYGTRSAGLVCQGMMGRPDEDVAAGTFLCDPEGWSLAKIIQNVDPDTVSLPKTFVIDLQERTMCAPRTAWSGGASKCSVDRFLV